MPWVAGGHYHDNSGCYVSWSGSLLFFGHVLSCEQDMLPRAIAALAASVTLMAGALACTAMVINSIEGRIGAGNVIAAHTTSWCNTRRWGFEFVR